MRRAVERAAQIALVPVFVVGLLAMGLFARSNLFMVTMWALRAPRALQLPAARWLMVFSTSLLALSFLFVGFAMPGGLFAAGLLAYIVASIFASLPGPEELPRKLLPRATSDPAAQLRLGVLAESLPPKVDGVGVIGANVISRLASSSIIEGNVGGGGSMHVQVLSGQATTPEMLGGENVDVEQTPGVRMPGQDYRVAAPSIKQLRQLSAASDVVWLLEFGASAMWATAYLFWKGVPQFLSLHTRLDLYVSYFTTPRMSRVLVPVLNAFMRIQLLYPERVVAVSTSHCEMLRSAGIRCDGVWLAGVDTSRFSPEKRTTAMRERLTAGHPERPLIVYIGRVSPEKNLHHFQPLLELMPDAAFAIVGDGDELPRLRTLLESGGVTFTGYLRGAELAEAYASADVFYLPSVTESWPLCVAEAMASGLPVVAPDRGGQTEQVRDDIEGHIVHESDNPAAIAAAIRDCLAHRDRMSPAAVERVQAFSWDACTSNLVAELHKSIPPSRPDPPTIDVVVVSEGAALVN